MRISIIIPIYNVEDYLVRCLDSVLQQIDDTGEVICVNDGSQDNSRNIVVEYRKKHSNITLIDRPNGGLSAARNTGISVAQGEYIVLLDSDDYLTDGVLPLLYIQAKKQNLDVLIANTQWVYSDNTIKKANKNSADIITMPMPGIDAYTNLWENRAYVPMAYNQLCKREFILQNNLFFKEGLIFEDELWTPQVLLKAGRVGATPIYHYNYFQREDTIIHSPVTQTKIDSLYYIIEQIPLLYEKLERKNEQLKSYLWLRTCELYAMRLKMIEKLSIKDSLKITCCDLLKNHLLTEQFNQCLIYLGYSKNQRRFLKMIHNIRGQKKTQNYW